MKNGFRTMFEEAPLGMAIIDSKTGDTYQANARYAQIIGRTKSELSSTGISDYSYPEEIEEIKKKISLLNSNELASFSSYKRLIKPDGEIVWVNLTIAPLNSEEDYSNPRLLCMIEDVTDRRKAEEEILYLSYYDQLTGLYNRRFYAEELRQARHGKKPSDHTGDGGRQRPEAHKRRLRPSGRRQAS